jgi:iron(III) transport system substrate-binding protein
MNTKTLAPRWKGRIGVNLQDPEWYVSLQRRWGKDKGAQLFKSSRGPTTGCRDGHNITAQLLAAGEFHAVCNTYAHIAARIKSKAGRCNLFSTTGDHLRSSIVLAKGAPHPNAGKLLISFILSLEGQRMLRDQGRIPGHREVEPQVFSCAT